MAQTDFDKAADRTRLNNLFQLIDKSLTRLVKKQNTEDLQQIRYASSKLLQILSAQEKIHKDLVFKQVGLLDILVNVIQQVSDEQALHNIISILNELVGRNQSTKRSGIMVNHGVTLVLFSILKQVVCQDISLPEELLLLCHLVLSKIGHKDRKFGIKARLHRALLLTLNLIKNNSSNFRYLQPLLQVLKLYTANSVNASYLGKHNAVSIMFRVISICSRKHAVSCRLAFENLSNMTKSKSNSARLIGMGGVPMLLTHHSDWHQADSKNRNISLRKAILNTLKNITNLKSGRQAFVESDGIRVLYNSAQEDSDSREVESLIMLASLIMRKCCPRNKLPLENVLSAVTYPLPHSDLHIPDCYTLPEFQASMSLQLSTSRQTGEDSDHSSLDDDDDIDSDDERFRTDNPDECEFDQGDNLDPPEVRTMEDLRMYDKFFPEVFEFDQYLSSSASDVDFSGSLRDKERSLFSFDGRKGDYSSFHQNSEECLAPSISRCRSTAGPVGGSTIAEPVTAVNLKMGYSVVQLDFQNPAGATSSTCNTRKSSLPLTGAFKSGPNLKGTTKKGSKMSLKKTLPIKDNGRKLKKTTSGKAMEDLSDSSLLCITPLATLRMVNNVGPEPVGDDLEQGTNSSCDDLDEEAGGIVHDPRVYCQMAAYTRSVYRFEKLAYPDLQGTRATFELESLYTRKFGVQRSKVFEDIDRMIHPETINDHVVYNLDKVVSVAGPVYLSRDTANLNNRDELRVGRSEAPFETLHFNAQFESGNLRKVIQVREFEYDLILNPDINTNHHHQWFYFEVSNMTADVDYRFNIVNCEKFNSQFNFGMQPVMFSVAEAMEGRGAWVRVGKDICYYRNHFLRSSQTTGGLKGKAYYTATFTIRFQHSCDVCYLAYHYPYTYTMLKTHLTQWEGQVNHSQVFFRYQQLCETIGGNSVPLLTITAQPRSKQREDVEELLSRPYIFLSGRVHPGESNSSWVMKGTVDFLMSNKPAAQQLRECYIFKIVPMLNPDGVINGNHRCSLVAEDLNRRWLKPCPRLHPSIYHTKGLLQYLQLVNKAPLVYCDYHGHSRKKNIFMYGCSPQMSWMPNDAQNPACTGNKLEDSGFKTLPRILHLSSAPFYLQNCSFVVERVKEATARVVVWRQIGVVRSYTMESSYCGCDQGKYKDQHLNTSMLEEMGHKFCEGLLRLAKTCTSYDQQLPDFGAAELGGFEGLDEGGRNPYLKPAGATCMFDDGDLGCLSEEDNSDGEENFGDDDLDE